MVKKDSWEQVKDEGDWHLQTFVGELASQHRLNLSSSLLKEVMLGGFHSHLNLQLGMLYKQKKKLPPLHSEATSAALPTPSPSPSPPPSTSSSQTAVEDDSESQLDIWPHSAIMFLLDCFRQKRNLLCSSTMRKMEVWEMIAADMGKKGYKFTAHSCAKKWDNMRNRYRIITDRNKATGRSRTTWRYLEEMAELMEGDPSVFPPVTVSSLSGLKENTTRVMSGEDPSPTLPLLGPPRNRPVAARPEAASPVGLVASSPSPHVTTGRKRRLGEVPQWAREMEGRSQNSVNQLVAVCKERNTILEKMYEKM